MSGNDKIWKSADLGRLHLEGVSAITLAAKQLPVLASVLRRVRPEVSSFLDIGCGDGVLGRVVHGLYPRAKGTFLTPATTRAS